VSHWFEDRLRATARLLTASQTGSLKTAGALAMIDPRLEFGSEGLKVPQATTKSRAAFDKAVALTGRNGASAQSVGELISICSWLQLELRQSGFQQEWDRHLAIAAIKASLPGSFPDPEAIRSLTALAGLVSTTTFNHLPPAQQLECLADLATIASIDRPGLGDVLMPALKTLVSQLSMLRRGEAGLVEFGGGAPNPVLASRLIAQPHGALNRAGTFGRVDWDAFDTPCTAWMGPAGKHAPALEVWVADQPLLTTAPNADFATSRTFEPRIILQELSLKRRDTESHSTLEASCQTVADKGAGALSWGRTLKVSLPDAGIYAEDWVLPSREAPTPNFNKSGLTFVLGRDVQLEQLAYGVWYLGGLEGPKWRLEASSNVLSWVQGDGVGMLSLSFEGALSRSKRLNWSLVPLAELPSFPKRATEFHTEL
jgi:hypothetical protein